jgi:hypothetical protein
MGLKSYFIKVTAIHKHPFGIKFGHNWENVCVTDLIQLLAKIWHTYVHRLLNILYICLSEFIFAPTLRVIFEILNSCNNGHPFDERNPEILQLIVSLRVQERF